MISPAEVVGLLYADCRKSLARGWKSIATALQHEVHRAAYSGGFWRRVEALLTEVFAGTGFVSVSNEYRSKDWEIVQLGIVDEFESEVEPPYDIIVDYGQAAKPLDEKFWSDYIDETESRGETLSLIVSERPVGFAVDWVANHLATRTIRDEVIGTSRHVVIADLSRETDEEQQKRILAAARDHLMAFVDLLQAEREQLRERHAYRTLEAEGQERLVLKTSRS